MQADRLKSVFGYVALHAHNKTYGEYQVVEKKDGKRTMPHVLSWQAEIEMIAGPYQGNRKSWLARAARQAGITYRQCKALYYGESEDPKHSIGMKVLTAAQQARLDEARRNAREVADYLDSYAQTLAESDADFHRPQIDAALAVVRQIRSGDSS